MQEIKAVLIGEAPSRGGDRYASLPLSGRPARVRCELVVEAVAASRALWGDPPEQGFVTFVDEAKVRRKRDPGRCFRRAGWFVGYTRSGKAVLQLLPDDFPDPDPPVGGEHPEGTVPLLPGYGRETVFESKRDTFGGGLRRYEDG